MARSQGARNYATKVLQSIYDTQISNDAIESEITITNVFARTFACKKRIILNRGGAGSSKSKSMSQLITYKMLYERNKAILILRKSLPSFKISTMPMIYNLVGEYYRPWDKDRYEDWENVAAAIHRNPWNFQRLSDEANKVGFQSSQVTNMEEMVSKFPENLRVVLTK